VSDPLLAAEGLIYEPPRGAFKLGPIDLTFTGGSLTLVSGRNGSGKSTLLSILSGRAGSLAGRASGRLFLLGEGSPYREGSALFGSVAHMGPRAEAELFCPSVREEISFALENLRYSRAERESRAERTAESLGISSLLDSDPRRLSGGEQKLVLIAALLAIEPRILILDEPLAGLSEANAIRVSSVLRAYADRGNLAILCEHRRDPLTAFADREIALEAGKVSYDGRFERTRPMRIETIAPSTPTATNQTHPPIHLPQTRIIAEGLSFDRDGRRIIDAHEISIPQGITILKGENGTGKTTLLRLFRGLLKPTRGSILYDGKRVRRASSAVGLAYLAQESRKQFFRLSVRDEIDYPLRFAGGHFAGKRRTLAELRKDANRLIETFALADLLDAYPLELSCGEQRRLAIAAVLATRPGFLLLDEPECGLDECHAGILARELARLSGEGVGQLISLHGHSNIQSLANGEITLVNGAQIKRNNNDR